MNKSIQNWLLTILLALLLLFIVGGITRLTHSGLSMTSWQPTRLLPPLNQAQWNESFKEYQKTQEFKQFAFDMSLPKFKTIYFWEYLHRLLARFLGVLFLLPYLYFLWAKKNSSRLSFKISFYFYFGRVTGFYGLVHG